MPSTEASIPQRPGSSAATSWRGTRDLPTWLSFLQRGGWLQIQFPKRAVQKWGVEIEPSGRFMALYEPGLEVTRHHCSHVLLVEAFTSVSRFQGSISAGNGRVDKELKVVFLNHHRLHPIPSTDLVKHFEICSLGFIPLSQTLLMVRRQVVLEISILSVYHRFSMIFFYVIASLEQVTVGCRLHRTFRTWSLGPEGVMGGM